MKGVDVLGLIYHYKVDPEVHGFCRAEVEYNIRKAIEQVERDMWNFTAPKVLKRIEGQEHTGPALLHRRIVCENQPNLFEYPEWESVSESET